MIDLSILVCSISSRYNTFLPKIQDQLYGQLDQLSPADQDRVEIIILTDNKTIMLGHKRNTMVEMAKGRYVAFVDDDDRLAPDYVSELLTATKTGMDSIVFKAEVSLDGDKPKICHYSKDVRRDYNHRDGYYRIPNHICCIKRELALQSKFPNILSGEDAVYSKQLLPLLNTEHSIDKILYYYDYNTETTEAQAWRRNGSNHKPGKAIVDVIMLSKASDQADVAMTQKAINSCLLGTNGLPINIIVIEGGFGVYTNATTIPNKDKFNFNQFANQGAALGTAKWIMVANNDLDFGDRWLETLLAAEHPMVSPHEPNDPRQADITKNTKGKVCGKHFSGWCFMLTRELWQQIDGFDTDVDFWCSDDVVIEQVLAAGVEPMIVKGSIVKHAVSRTFSKQSAEVQREWKWRNVYIFNKKYNKNKFADHQGYRMWLANNKGKLPKIGVK